MKKDLFELLATANNWLQDKKTITGLFTAANSPSLLIATNNGFGVYNTESQTTILSNNFKEGVKHLYQDNKGIIWAATNKGLHRFIVNKTEINILNEYPIVLNKLKENQITSITQDGTNRYWIATATNAVYVYNENDNTLQQINLPQKTGRGYAIKDMYYDTNKAIMYISLDGGGLICYDNMLAIKIVYQNNEDDFSTISNNAVYDIFKDSYEQLWVTTYGGGVNVVMPEVQPFKNYLHEINNNNSLSNNAAKAIAEDGTGQIWFGTRKGLSKLNVGSNQWQQFNEENTGAQFTSDNILAITTNKKNEVYVATYGGGIIKINNATTQITAYKNNTNDSTTLGTDFVYALYYDSKGLL